MPGLVRVNAPQTLFYKCWQTQTIQVWKLSSLENRQTAMVCADNKLPRLDAQVLSIKFKSGLPTVLWQPHQPALCRR
jgi:hypothetical protein